MEASNYVVGNDGCRATRLIWGIIGALTVGGYLFGEMKGVAALFVCREKDVISRPKTDLFQEGV